MPVMDGIQATKHIKDSYPQVEVLILTSFSDRDHVIPAIEAGAAGYQLKDIEPDELVTCIRKIMRGENTIHPHATTHLMKIREQKETPPHIFNPLTPREQDVLAELTKGKSNREIASSLICDGKNRENAYFQYFSKAISSGSNTSCALCSEIWVNRIE